MRSKVVVVAALMAAAVGLSACGGSSGGAASNSSAGGSGSSAGFSAESRSTAQKLIDQYSNLPEAPKLAPLATKPSPGKLVTMISCPVPQCTALADEFTKAGKAVGWNIRVIVSQFTPESFTSSWDSALSLHPDYLYYFPLFPDSTIQGQLARAKQAGIPVVENGVTPDVKVGGDSPISAGTQFGQLEQAGQFEAAIVMADAKSRHGITFMYQPGNSVYEANYHAFKKAIEENGGTVDVLEVNQANIGTTLPGQIVSYLQSHPDTKYLVNPGSHFLPGVVEAIKAAGIPLPKIVSYAAEAHTAKDISAGDVYGAYVIDVYAEQWVVMDYLARLSVGEQPSPELKDPVMIVTSKNAGQFPAALPFPGITEAYKAAWGIQ